MFDKAETEYTELSDKKRIVEADKAKIEKVRRLQQHEWPPHTHPTADASLAVWQKWKNISGAGSSLHCTERHLPRVKVAIIYTK